MLRPSRRGKIAALGFGLLIAAFLVLPLLRTYGKCRLGTGKPHFCRCIAAKQFPPPLLQSKLAYEREFKLNLVKCVVELTVENTPD